MTTESRDSKVDGPPSVMVELLRREIAEQARLKEAAEKAHQTITNAEKQVAEQADRLRAQLAEEEKEHVAQAVAEAEAEASRIMAKATARSEEKLRAAGAAKTDLIARGIRLILDPDEASGTAKA